LEFNNNGNNLTEESKRKLIEELNAKFALIIKLNIENKYSEVKNELDKIKSIAQTFKLPDIYNRAVSFSYEPDRALFLEIEEKEELELQKSKEKPEKIYNKYKLDALSLEEASEQIKILLENATDDEVRLNCLEFIKQLKAKDKKTYLILENFCVSEYNPKVRHGAVLAIIDNYKGKAINLLLFVFKNDQNFEILYSIANFLNHLFLKLKIKNLKETQQKEKDVKAFLELMNELGEYYKAKPEQAIILTMLEKLYPGKFTTTIESGDVTSIEFKSQVFSQTPSLSWIKHFNKLKSLILQPKDLQLLSESDIYLYYGVKPDQAKFLADINEITGKPIPCLKDITKESYGFKTDNVNYLGSKEIIELGLFIKVEKRSSFSKHRRIFQQHIPLESLPPSIGTLKSLKKLYLNRNNLKTLPDSIGNLTSLQMLDLSENRLEILPESIGNLTSLQILDIIRNKLIDLPKSMENLIILKSLSIDYLQASNFSEQNLRFYYGVKPEQFDFLMDLNKLDVNLIPLIDKFEEVKFGIVVDDQNFVGGKNVIKIGLELFEQREKRGILSPPGRRIPVTVPVPITKHPVHSIPNSIGNLTSLQELHIKENQINTLPDSIGTLTELMILDLEDNDLTILPESIGNLNRLNILKLKGNNLIRLPNSIGKLNLIKDLDFEKQGLKTLPESIGSLTSLQTLNLKENNLKSLPDSIGNLSSLQKLYVQENLLTNIPETIGNLSLLQILDFSHNKLLSIPRTIGNLSFLKIFLLSYNNLSTIPESIGKLESLQILSITNNNLNALPISIGRLKNLKKLQLWRNVITILPNEIGYLSKLEILDVNNNLLIKLPESIENLTSLKEIRLGTNNLGEVPEILFKIKNLQYLDLYSCNLTNLSESIGNLHSLWHLDIRRNKLSFLPASIGNLKILRNFWIDHNQLEALPESIGDMESIAKRTSPPTIDLSNNRLAELPKTINKLGIQSIKLENNNFSSIPQILSDFEKLKRLNLSGNKLSSIPDFVAEFEDLEILDLRNNKIETLPSFIAELKSLRSLYLRGNPLYDIPDIMTLNTLKNLRRELFERNPKLFFILEKENPAQYIKSFVDEIPLDKRAKVLYDFGKKIAHVKITNVQFGTSVDVKEYEDSNLELGAHLMKMATELPNCPNKVYEILPHLFRVKNKWNEVTEVYEKAFKSNNQEPMYLTGLLEATLMTGRQEITDKYIDYILENEKFLENPYLISNVIYALNRQENEKSSEISLNLTKSFWLKHEKKMITTLWINMTDAYIVANMMDPTLEEMISEMLNNLEKMHPIAYENIAWYYLKSNQINKALQYLREAKDKLHPGFKAIKNSKYFSSLKDNPQFLKLFDA